MRGTEVVVVYLKNHPVRRSGGHPSFVRRGAFCSVLNTFPENLTYSGSKWEMPVFIDIRRLQSFHVGILAIITAF
jgi:hypothetical protein